MDIHLDFRSRIPIYTQIMSQIKQLVASGTLKPGDQLPTVRQLAQDLRVNFNTIARAYRQLDEEGIISTQHGRGTYILEPPTELNGERLREEVLETLTDTYIADALQMGYDLDAVRLVFCRHADEWEEKQN